MKPEKLILDYSKWRCGYTAHVECINELGMGPVRLLNNKGFMCCLGQFSKQMGIDDTHLLNESNPGNIGHYLPLFNKPTGSNIFLDTELSEECMRINDDPETTPGEKIKSLTELLSKEGIQLEVINKP